MASKGKTTKKNVGKKKAPSIKKPVLAKLKKETCLQSSSDVAEGDVGADINTMDRASSYKAKIKEVRAKAASTSLNVLVWGPGEPPPGSTDPEWDMRCKIRDLLTGWGHNPYFSEDLIAGEPCIFPNPIDDEKVQAYHADATIMVYGSRGTQSETDKILTFSNLAIKTVILINEDTYITVGESVTAQSWQKIERLCPCLIKYTGDTLNKGQVQIIEDYLAELRYEVFMKAFERKLHGI